MAIMKIELSDDIMEIARMTGYKNIGFTFELHVDRNEYFSCTCGHSCEKKDLIQIGSESVSPKEEELIKSSIIEGGPVVYKEENYFGTHICPVCGTPIIYEYIEASKDACPVKYIPTVLQDDERFLAVSIEIYGIEFFNYNLSASMEDCKDEWVLLFDKSVKKLYVVEYDYPLYTNCKLNKNLRLEDGCFLDEDDDTACSDTNISIGNYDNGCIYHSKRVLAMVNGFQEIADIFSKEVGIPLKPETHSDLHGNVKSLYTLCNFGYMQDKRMATISGSSRTIRDENSFPTWIIPHGELNTVRDFFERCMEADVDLDARTVEDAFKVSLEELKKIKNISFYKAYMDSKKRIEEFNLSDYSKFLLNRIEIASWKRLFKVADNYQKDADTVIRSIVRSKGIAPWEALGIVERIYQCDKENASRIVNLDFPVTRTTKAKQKLLEEEFFTIEQYDALAKKPTLDNFYKTIIGSCEN